MFVTQVVAEPVSVAQAVCELVQLAQGQVALHALLAQTEAIYLALDKSRDLVLVSDHNHNIQVTLPRIVSLFICSFDRRLQLLALTETCDYVSNSNPEYDVKFSSVNCAFNCITVMYSLNLFPAQVRSSKRRVEEG